LLSVFIWWVISSIQACVAVLVRSLEWRERQ